MKRYPLADLARALGIPLEQLGGRLNVRGSTWQDYRDRGVSALVADRMATKLDLHPYVVWPEMAEDDIASVSRECAREGCTRTFVLKLRGTRRRYCSQTCRKAGWKAEQMADPAFVQRNRDQAAAYYAAATDYCRARQRRYYQANAEAERARSRENRRKARAA